MPKKDAKLEALRQSLAASAGQAQLLIVRDQIQSSNRLVIRFAQRSFLGWRSHALDASRTHRRGEKI
jgi:hypothetical protein